MKLDREAVLEHLEREGAEPDALGVAEARLPARVDTTEHRELLEELGVDVDALVEGLADEAREGRARARRQRRRASRSTQHDGDGSPSPVERSSAWGGGTEDLVKGGGDEDL